MTRTLLYLVRHGEQERAAGAGEDGGLTQLGREQAHRLGRRLGSVPGFTAIHHSPSTRATQTAAAVAEHLPQVPRHACGFVADRNELLITHNFVIGWFVRHVLDAPEWRWIGLDQDHCAITVVQWQTDRPPSLISFNDTGHLQGGS